MVFRIKNKRKTKAIKSFELIRDKAELRALSKISLERPLTKKEFEKTRVLRKRIGI